VRGLIRASGLERRPASSCLDHNSKDFAGRKKVGIVGANNFGIADDFDTEWLEERPVVEVMPIARAVINTA
jgi:hypothetical protein